jgi:hypothetical protein
MPRFIVRSKARHLLVSPRISQNKNGGKMKNRKRGGRYNSVTHGIFSRLILNEVGFETETEDYSRLMSQWREVIAPRNDLEETFVEKLALLTLRTQRVFRADLDSAPQMFARTREALEPDQNSPEVEFINRENQFLVVRNRPPFESLSRYEVHIGREISRILDQLEHVRRICADSAKQKEDRDARPVIPKTN